jgi:hypothetical protein
MLRPAVFATLLRTLLTMSVISLGMGLGANSAAAEEAVVTVLPLNVAFTNPCTGEAMVFSGEQHMKVHMVATDQHTQGALEVNWRNAKAVALVTFAPYVASLAGSSVSNAGPNETSIIQFHQNITRLQEDPAAIAPSMTGDDFVLTVTEKLTVNANGTITVTHPFEMTTKCR